jgi:hypothetical protein
MLDHYLALSHAGGWDAGASLDAFPRWSVGTIIEKTTVEANSSKKSGLCQESVVALTFVRYDWKVQ